MDIRPSQTRELSLACLSLAGHWPKETPRVRKHWIHLPCRAQRSACTQDLRLLLSRFVRQIEGPWTFELWLQDFRSCFQLWPDCVRCSQLWPNYVIEGDGQDVPDLRTCGGIFLIGCCLKILAITRFQSSSLGTHHEIPADWNKPLNPSTIQWYGMPLWRPWLIVQPSLWMRIRYVNSESFPPDGRSR